MPQEPGQTTQDDADDEYRDADPCEKLSEFAAHGAGLSGSPRRPMHDDTHDVQTATGIVIIDTIRAGPRLAS